MLLIPIPVLEMFIRKGRFGDPVVTADQQNIIECLLQAFVKNLFLHYPDDDCIQRFEPPSLNRRLFHWSR